MCIDAYSHVCPLVYVDRRYVPLKTIGQRILQGYGGEQFGDFRGTLGGLLAAYHYEASILHTASKLIARDTFQAMDAAYRYADHVITLLPLCACTCNGPLPRARTAGNFSSEGNTY